MSGGGKWLTLIGAALLIGIVAHTGWVVWGRQPPTCKIVTQPAKDASFYSSQTEIDLNGYLCLAWRPKRLFAAENLARTVKTDAVNAAKADVEKAQAHATEIAAGGDATAIATANAALKQAQTRRDDAQTQVDALPKTAPLVLFIDGKPAPIAFDAEIQDTDDWVWAKPPLHLRVPEDAKSDDAKAWRGLLSSGGGHGTRSVTVALGDAGAKFPRKGTDLEGMKLRILEPFWVASGALAFLVMTVGLILWGWNSGMMRDRSPADANDKPPFSLGRVQMAWWFILSLAGFLFIWLLSGQWMSVLTMSVVALVGISGASGAAAMAIDAADPTATKSAQSQGFFRDITSSGDGVVLHRVQMLVWTIVMGLIFAWSVVWNFGFPAYDDAMLVLAGVVNGVYVGFKFPEKKLAT